MSAISNIHTSLSNLWTQAKPVLTNKVSLIAISCFMFLAMTLSTVFYAPWYVAVLFFTLALAPLFPLGRARGDVQINFPPLLGIDP